jgi:dTDP-glucose 4,6-dehydratase
MEKFPAGVMKILVTGGAGFIGGHFATMFAGKHRIINYDSLAYAANPGLIPDPDTNEHIFIKGDICDREALLQAFRKHRPDWVVNFAAETHVDRSIDGPAIFVKTNILGTCELLEVARYYWETQLNEVRRQKFRFLHVSTDEVYGSLGKTGKFTETTPYAPNSPYAASKAAADHFVRAYHKTYGLPVITTNCSNNYGPRQFPEKLIPLMILNAMEDKDLPVYGDGQQIRDWLYVEDHCLALELILKRGRVGEVYNIGGNCERTNLSIVTTIRDLVGSGKIVHVEDRPGHDRRYAIDCSKLEQNLGWAPQQTFEIGLETTIKWYKKNKKWIEDLTNYRQERLGRTQARDY